MKKDLAKRKAAIWAKWERKWQRKLSVYITDDFREQCESDIFPMDDDVMLEDLEGYLEDLSPKLESFLEGIEAVNYFSNRKKPEVTATKHYQRCFEKRLYLVRFVLAAKSLTPGKRIDWEQICSYWNEMHPNDPFTKGVLKVRYYRALAEEDIERICSKEEEERMIENLSRLFEDDLIRDKVINLYKKSLQYAQEAEELEGDEAEERFEEAKIIAREGIKLMKQQVELSKKSEQSMKKSKTKEAHDERSHNKER
ncbi:hypothetical protein ACFLWZ_00535 [Chloroflexota bacterium]